MPPQGYFARQLMCNEARNPRNGNGLCWLLMRSLRSCILGLACHLDGGA